MDTWKVTDYEGDFISDEDGTEIVFTNYEQAKKAARRKGGAVVVQKADEEEIPAASELSSLQQTHTLIVAEATAHVRSTMGPLDPDLEDAHVARQIIRQIQERRGHLRTITLATIAEVSIRNLHIVLGFKTIKDFLKSAGMTESDGDLWRGVNIGDHVIPWMKKNGVDVAEFIGPGVAPKFITASTALKRSIKEGDPEKTHDMLELIRTAPGRDAVRAQLHIPRSLRGSGYANKDIVVLHITKGDLQWVKDRLGTSFAWDMIGSVEKTEGKVRIDVAL